LLIQLSAQASSLEPRQNCFQSRDGLGPVTLLQVEQDLEALSLLADKTVGRQCRGIAAASAWSASG